MLITTSRATNLAACIATTWLTIITAQASSLSLIVQPCPGFETPKHIACVKNYAAVLPSPFHRSSGSNGTYLRNDTFIGTSVPSDPSFASLRNASFVVFDQKQSLNILGPSPKVELVFETAPLFHEAPVYVPGLNAIIFSTPFEGIYQQQIIDLNSSTPTMSNFTTEPPVYAVNSGRLYRGHVYWAVEASFSFPSPANGSKVMQAPGIYKLDPYSRQVTPLLNNYFGTLFNSPNDLVIDKQGDIWFTDSWYGYAINVTGYPVHRANTYRFRPSTGAVSIVENTLDQPNGIAISPDGKTMYISDTGAADVADAPADVIPRIEYNPFGGRVLYAFDIISSPAGDFLVNKRPIWLAQEYIVDGLHVSKEGCVVGAAGSGVDILSKEGQLIMRIIAPATINNLQFAGPDLSELWLFGQGVILKVTGLKGLHGMSDE